MPPTKSSSKAKPKEISYEIPFTQDKGRGKEISPYLQCDKKGEKFTCGIYADDMRIKPIKEPISSIHSISVDSITITNDGDRFILQPGEYGMKCDVTGGKGEDLRMDCSEI